MQEQPARLAGHPQAVVLVRERASGGAVDGLPVDGHPAADGAQPLGAGPRDHPLRGGAHVEQVVHALAGQVDQQQDQRVRRFPVVVGALVAPRVIEGGRRLVVGADAPRRDLVVAQAAVVAHVVADAARDQAVGLQLVHEVAQLDRVLAADGVGGVEPDQADGPVLGQQLAELRLDLAFQVGCEVLAAFVEVPVVARPVRVVPVLVLRVVEAELDARFRACLRQLGQRVAAERRGVDDVVRAARRAEDGEPVVVLGGDDQVAHPRLHRQLHPRARVEAHGVETLGERRVRLPRDAPAEHDPLADARHLLALPHACRDGVQAPVDEHPEARLPPPGQPRVVDHRSRVASAHAVAPAHHLCHEWVIASRRRRCKPLPRMAWIMAP